MNTPDAQSTPSSDSRGRAAAEHSAVIYSAVDLVRAAAAQRLTVGTAESLTGGDVASAMVSVPGASSCFEGGVISYSHAVKTGVLGVDEELLREHGAVHDHVALQMAAGARRVLGVDWAVSTTGVAGPEAHDGYPVGTVFIGISGPLGDECEKVFLQGDRDTIRAASTARAIHLLASHMGFPAKPQ